LEPQREKHFDLQSCVQQVLLLVFSYPIQRPFDKIMQEGLKMILTHILKFNDDFN
jgi:hypothetical protein